MTWETTQAAKCRALQRAIADDSDAAGRVFDWLDARDIVHTGIISGTTLAAVAGVEPRTWRRWVGGERQMPLSAWRLLVEVAGVDVDRAIECLHHFCRTDEVRDGHTIYRCSLCAIQRPKWYLLPHERHER